MLQFDFWLFFYFQKNLRKRWAEREKLEKNERFLCEYLLDKKYEVEDVDEKYCLRYCLCG